MIYYYPNANELVYSEMNFIATGGRMPIGKSAIDFDAIIDEVSAEIYEMFVGELPVADKATQTAFVMMTR